MPELPDVEALRAAVEWECQGRRLLRVELKEQGGGPREGLFDDAVFDKASEAAVKRAMEGKVLTSTGRKGKYMWIVLEGSGGGGGGAKSSKGKKSKGTAAAAAAASSAGSQQHVLLHMGMTGSLVVKGKDVPQYKAFSISAASWPPRYTKAEFVFEGGVHLAYCDPRRWGRITLKADVTAEPPVSDLAPDAWKELPDLDAFKSAFRGSAMPVKALLLDQGKLVSGVGNWVADEICYLSRVDPAKRCSALRDDEIEAIRTQTFEVCEIACKANADADGFPAHWLFHHRWANKAKGVKMPNGDAIVFETIGGRTTAIVPKVQRARGGGGGGGGKQQKKAKAVAAAAAAADDDDDDDDDEDSKPAAAAVATTTVGGRKRKAAAVVVAVKEEVDGVPDKAKVPTRKRGRAVGGGEEKGAGETKPAAGVKRGRGSKRT